MAFHFGREHNCIKRGANRDLVMRVNTIDSMDHGMEVNTHLHISPLEDGGENGPETETGHFIESTEQL